VESALYSHPAVSECAVVGVPDARWGEVGLAALVLKSGCAVSAEELRGYLKELLAGYKVPRHFRFLEALPKSGAGKILKNELAREFAEEAGHAAS
ncbi:MAG TPA: long-chain fatty acid--CoA ligase, partial [Trueperaceae bacterium]